MVKKRKNGDFAKELRQFLSLGELHVGDKLPAETELVGQFGVSRTLVRETMKSLSTEGIIVTRHGSGTYLQHVPRKRIEVFVKFDNIISSAGIWYRDQIEFFRKICLSTNWDLDLLVCCGETQDELTASFFRQISRPTSSDLMGSIVLFYCAKLEEGLARRNVPFVTVIPYGNVKLLGKSVILDYSMMAKLMKKELAKTLPERTVLFAVDDKIPEVSRAEYDSIHLIYETLAPPPATRVLIPHIDLSGKYFCDWINEHHDEIDTVVFIDDGVCSLALLEALLQGVNLGDISIITQSKEEQRLDFARRIFRVGFNSRQIGQAAWDVLFDKNQYSQAVISPRILTNEKQGGRHD